jgi:hypothetical protein
MLFHDSQKLRQIDDSALRRLAMGQVADQVLRAWFQTRGEPFPGEVRSMYELRRREPSMLDLLEQALVTSSVDRLVEAAELAAAPAGGVFSPSDVLAVSWTRPAVEPIPELLRQFVAQVADGQAPAST